MNTKLELETVRSDDSELWINGEKIDAYVGEVQADWDEDANAYRVVLVLYAEQVIAGHM